MKVAVSLGCLAATFVPGEEDIVAAGGTGVWTSAVGICTLVFTSKRGGRLGNVACDLVLYSILSYNGF